RCEQDTGGPQDEEQASSCSAPSQDKKALEGKGTARPTPIRCQGDARRTSRGTAMVRSRKPFWRYAARQGKLPVHFVATAQDTGVGMIEAHWTLLLRLFEFGGARREDRHHSRHKLNKHPTTGCLAQEVNQ